MTSFAFPLTWASVVEATAPLDAGAVREVVERALRAALPDYPRKELAPSWTRDTLEVALELALADGVGAWAALFDWSSSEPGGGGPVAGGIYCCASHSLLPGADVDARATVARVLPFAIARTGAEDAWYATFAALVIVCLEGLGLDREAVEPVVHDVASGRFESWVAPDEATSEAAGREIGARVADSMAAHTAGQVQLPDATERWAATRASLADAYVPAWRVPLGWDGHLRFVDGTERARDRSRADAMRAALEACREDARRGVRLDVARLTAWQRLVLGRPTALRTTDAFAKGGFERYAARPDLATLLDAWLREADDPRVPLPIRAVRVYLDVCFAHPFEDGNARAARLAMDHVLTKAGLGLRAVGPVVTLARAPDDVEGAAALVRLVALLAAPA